MEKEIRHRDWVISKINVPSKQSRENAWEVTVFFLKISLEVAKQLPFYLTLYLGGDLPDPKHKKSDK